MLLIGYAGLSDEKVGHAGTLDPMATGLLILLIGKATKISQYLKSPDKVYGTMYLGQSTDSHDAEGEVVKEMELPADLDAENLCILWRIPWRPIPDTSDVLCKEAGRSAAIQARPQGQNSGA